MTQDDVDMIHKQALIIAIVNRREARFGNSLELQCIN